MKNEFDTADEHQHMVAALVKAPDEIIATLDTDRVDVLHGVIGVVGEVGEIVNAIRGIMDRENLIEELGDIEFYMTQVRARLGIDFEPVPLEERGTYGFDFHTLVIEAADLLDITKKVVIYNRTLDADDFKTPLRNIDRQLSALRDAHRITRQETLQGNIDKLAKRYPDFQYTDQRAEDRMDKSS